MEIGTGPVKMGMLILFSFRHQGPVGTSSVEAGKWQDLCGASPIGPTLLMYNLYEPALM